MSGGEHTRLTKGQREFIAAVEAGDGKQFHRSVIEPVERMGLVSYNDGLRLIGRNAFPASMFALSTPTTPSPQTAISERGR